MAEEKLIRIKRLKAALESRHIAQPARARHLKDKCGSSVGYWSGLLAGDRSFGEKVARSVEESLQLPRGYLDQEGLSLHAMEVGELFDQLDPRGQAVLIATAHALMRPGTASEPPEDGPAPPLPAPKPSQPADQKTPGA